MVDIKKFAKLLFETLFYQLLIVWASFFCMHVFLSFMYALTADGGSIAAGMAYTKIAFDLGSETNLIGSMAIFFEFTAELTHLIFTGILVGVVIICLNEAVEETNGRGAKTGRERGST